jgi:hypothetical protein
MECQEAFRHSCAGKSERKKRLVREVHADTLSRMLLYTLCAIRGKGRAEALRAPPVTGRYRLEPQCHARQGGIICCIIIEPGPGSQINIPGLENIIFKTRHKRYR